MKIIYLLSLRLTENYMDTCGIWACTSHFISRSQCKSFYSNVDVHCFKLTNQNNEQCKEITKALWQTNLPCFFSLLLTLLVTPADRISRANVFILSHTRFSLLKYHISLKRNRAPDGISINIWSEDIYILASISPWHV